MEATGDENRNQLSENDEKDRRNMRVVLKTLRTNAITNMEYFQDGSDTTRSRFHATFCLLHDHLERGIEPFVDLLFKVAGKYDACGVRANGYRSLIKIIQRCCITVLQITRHICVNRESMLFRSSHYCQELEAYVTCLGQLRACLFYVEKLPEWGEEGSLFADEDKLLDEAADELMMEVESLNQECFYGRCLGFQYCESLQKPFRMIAIAMASFSDGFSRDTTMAKFASSVMSSGKYFMNPELRAQQVVATTTNADIMFCKAFWNLTEHDFFKDLPMIVCPPVHLSQPIIVHPDSFELPRRDNKGFATILPPTAHRGPGPIYCRLISHEYREGQEQLCKKDVFQGKSAPPSPCLIIHCHGGGFVAQSSKSHETYLRHWARDLRVPILSIDYSLAPEDPFPRAVEECFFIYAWALDNCDLLGSTGEHICLCGDSAGGNLILSMCVKAIQEGIRLPDGIMAAYPAVLVRFTPTPSRLLAIMDPLLPVGILSRCLAAYAGVAESDIPKHFAAAKRKNSTANAIVEQPRKSHKRRHSTSLTHSNGSQVKFMVGEREESYSEMFCGPCHSDPDVIDKTLSDLADRFCEEECSDTKTVVGGGSLDLTLENLSGVPHTVQSCDGRYSNLENSKPEVDFGAVGIVCLSSPSCESKVPPFGDVDKVSPASPPSSEYYDAGNVTPQDSEEIEEDTLCESLRKMSRSDCEDVAKSSFSDHNEVDGICDKTPVSAGDLVLEVTENTNLGSDKPLEVGESLAEGSLSVEGEDNSVTENEGSIVQTEMTVKEDDVDGMMVDGNTVSEVQGDGCLAAEGSKLSDNANGESVVEGKFSVLKDKDLASKEENLELTTVSGAEYLVSEIGSVVSEVLEAENLVAKTGEVEKQPVQVDKELVCRDETLVQEDENLVKENSENMDSNCDNQNVQSVSSCDNNVNSEVSLELERSSAIGVNENGTGLDHDNGFEVLKSDLASKRNDSETDLGKSASLVRNSDNPVVFQSKTNISGENSVSGDTGELGNVISSQTSVDCETSLELESAETTSVLGKTSCEVPNTSADAEGIVIGCDAVNLEDAPCSGDEIDDVKSDTVDSGFSNSEEEWAIYEESDIAAIDEPKDAQDGVQSVGAMAGTERTSKSVAKRSPASAWTNLVHQTWSISNKFTNKDSLKLNFQNFTNYMGLSKHSTGSMRRSPSTPTLPTKANFRPEKRNISSFKDISHPLHHFRYLPVTKDPLMSPILASDEILSQMPPVYLVASHLDPLLDDSVMFARKLEKLGREVHLDVLEDIPHGFLNFVLLSKEAKKGADKCVANIREILMKNMKNSTPKIRKLSRAQESKSNECSGVV